MDLGITDSEIGVTLEPFVVERFSTGDPKWTRLAAENARLQRRKRLKRQLIGWLPWKQRGQARIEFAYNRIWEKCPVEFQITDGSPVVPCLWRRAGMLARVIAIKRVHLLFFMRVINRFKPTSVLEVGCGNGLNLFILAGRFPEVRFTGVDFTWNGPASAQALRMLPQLPDAVRTFAPEPLIDVNPSDRIAVVQGNAASLPFPDHSFDLVFTCLALEQMEEIRTKALTEIRRVVRLCTAMIEPFREWNESGPQRDYVVANSYFTGQIADLPSFGLIPLLATADIPCKLTFRSGLVVCRVHRQD